MGKQQSKVDYDLNNEPSSGHRLLTTWEELSYDEPIL
jgi:hypothetical protein